MIDYWINCAAKPGPAKSKANGRLWASWTAGVGAGANNRSLKSYDGGKKVKGIKLHVVVDGNGFLLAVMVTVAHIHDSQAVLGLMNVLQDCYAGLKTVLADGGYRGEIIETVKRKFGYLLQVVMRKPHQKNGFTPVGKRWPEEKPLPGLKTTGACAAITNCSWNHKRKWLNSLP